MKHATGGGFAVAVLAIAFALSACNSSKNIFKQEELPDPVEQQKIQQYQQQIAMNATANSTVVKQGNKLKDGTYIRVLVNGEAITNTDIQRRLAFMKVRRIPGANMETATEEMIGDEIKMQEARKAGTVASDADVNDAFANFAKGNKTTPDRIAGELNKIGVGAQHFKDYIRTQISWNRVLSNKFREDTGSVTQRDAIVALRKSGTAKPQTYEYDIQQVIFVVPPAKRATMLAARRAEANAARQRFTNCASTILLAKQLRDVSMFERKRILEPELPANWKPDLIKTAVGATTPVQESDKGVEFIAVCAKRLTSDDRAAQVMDQSKKYDSFGGQGDAVSEKYLKEARDKAKIIHR